MLTSCTEAERVQPVAENAPAHDAVTRLLHRVEPNTEALWNEAQKYISRDTGILVIDDSTKDQVLCLEDGVSNSTKDFSLQFY